MDDTTIVGDSVAVMTSPQGAWGAAWSGVSWSAVIAGALTAIAVSFIIISLGSGIGMELILPYSYSSSASASTMTVIGTGCGWYSPTRSVLRPAAMSRAGFAAVMTPRHCTPTK